MIVVTLTSEKDREQVEKVCEEYWRLKDDLESIRCGLLLLSQVTESGPLGLWNACRRAELRHDGQLVRDFICALDAFKKRCEDRMSCLTLTLGKDCPHDEESAEGTGR